MNTPLELAQVYINHDGQQVIAERIDAVNYYSQREKIQVSSFTQDDIERLRKEYVPTTALGEAVKALRARNAVGLVGPPGCGRRTTGVAAIIELEATPYDPIYLDPEDKHRELPVTRGCGYLIALDEDAVREIDGLRDLLAAYRKRLAAAGAYLVVTATQAAWGMLGQQTELTTVTVQLPDPVAVFRSHLRYLHPGAADEAASRKDVIEVLAHSHPADAVRLVQLVSDALSRSSGTDPVQEAISAYHNWTGELTTWFRINEAGYPRALLLSAATLNGADAATVFVAADRLSARVGLARPPGGGLVGDGVLKLIGDIKADLTDDGRICLPRPAYPVSVLDHVWQDRPQLRGDLKAWLVDLPESLGADQVWRAGETLVDLAVRQGDAALITSAVNSWARPTQVYRDLATSALTRAAVDDGIGQPVRRTMYRWATSTATDPNLQVTIADTCGGAFGRKFPSNAVTRLRHLALRGSPVVHEHVTASLRALAASPGLEDFTLREIITWSASETRARVPAMNAFIAIAVENADSLVPGTPSDKEQIELVASGIRAVLRDPDHVLVARELCRTWLEAVVQGKLPKEVVTDIIAVTCTDSYDIGLLASVVLHWGNENGRSAALVPREQVAALTLRKLADRDPLAPGVSAKLLRSSRRDSVPTTSEAES